MQNSFLLYLSPPEQEEIDYCSNIHSKSFKLPIELKYERMEENAEFFSVKFFHLQNKKR